MGFYWGYHSQCSSPLYGIPESGLNWYISYLFHHVDQMGTTKANIDPYLFTKNDKNGLLQVVVVLQVDNTQGIGRELSMQK